MIKVGLGHSTDVQQAIEQAMKTTSKPDLIICFASFSLNLNQVYHQIRRVVGEDVPIIGGSSAGEFSSLMDSPVTDSIAIMTLQSAYFSVGVGIGTNLHASPKQAASRAIGSAYANLEPNPMVMSLVFNAMDGKDASDISRIKPCINMVLPDGTSRQEEAFLRQLILETGSVSQIVGGSTANDFSSQYSYQICNGVYQDSAVVASFSSGLKMGTSMGHPYLPSTKGAVVTKSQGRVVYTLNGKPAVEILQNLMESDELTPELFVQHPFGIKSSDVFGEYTIKSAQAVNEDGSVSFYAEIPQGAFLRSMKTDQDTAKRLFRETLIKAIEDAGNPKKIAAVIVFNCILRHLLKCHLGVNDLILLREVCGEKVPLIGFNTFGEQGATMGGSIGHYNQTATVMVLAAETISQ
ncbi:hypothetical protein BGP75_07370 [Motiliproteus sp. MSK22-1]|nr:hypothetical protein BGP75_07370 [Motiliproteus sp. MSK22-1]